MTIATFLKTIRPYVIGFTLVSFLLTACSEDDPVPGTPKDESAAAITKAANQHVNSWILESMQYWYLWNDQLPDDIDQNINPESYFRALLHSDDRFSWIQDNYQDLLNSLQGISKEAGYEYVLYPEKEGSNNVILQILYIKPESPAEAAGLKRGDMVTHINDRQITTGNYQELLSGIGQDHTLRYQPLLIAEEKFGEATTVSLSTVQYAENPNYLHKVITSGDSKIGYFVYNFFAAGTESQPGQYDAEMDAIFSDFKAEGITDLVIDLRFNSGGTETSAKNLASLIGKNIDADQIFAKRKYNAIVEEDILNDEALGAEFLVSRFADKPGNVGNQLQSGRVYILTSSRTASASELIINALKPFMEVFLIGDTTYGKNVGSISLFAENDDSNTWGMQPIVVKVYNSTDQSDYSQGFPPDVLHKDNNVHLYPLGDPREALLGQAIAQITGTATLSREGGETRTLLAHSLDFKRRSFRLIIE